MWAARKINLRPGEEIIEVIHRAFILSVFGYAVGLLFLLTTSFFSTWLSGYGRPGYGVIIAGLFFGGLISLRTWLKRRFNYWLVTNQRVVDIDRLGLFDKVVSEIWFAEMGDIYFRKKGFFAAIFNYANIIIESGGEQFILEARHVSRPQQIIEWLQELKEISAEAREMEDHGRMVKNFIKVIPFMSEEELDEVAARIKEQEDEMVGRGKAGRDH